MGGEQSGRRKQIYLCLAILIFLSPTACALNQMMSPTIVDTTGEEALERLDQGRKFLSRGDYANALKENERVLSLAGRNTPVDQALFYVGLINALPANPKRNQGKSIAAFRRLIKEYPGSSLVEPAKGMVDLLQDNDTLYRRVDRLNNIIDELKKVDIDVDQKRAEHAKTIGILMQENDKLSRTVDKLNNVIDELKKVDIDVDQKKREQIK
ncbi:MAG: outer membrane protein assembly factor BamD [Syntrophales bacterium]